MAFTPDLPFPKSAGDPLKSKDWNDLVVETKRLDTAKVERAGDAITGSLSVAGTLAVGKTVAASTAKLDVAGTLALNDNNLMLRAGSDGFHGLGWFGGSKLFAGANLDGPALWGNAGGALGTMAGGTQKVALSWNSSGNVAIGVPSTELKVDIGDRIRLRQGSSQGAGLSLYQNTPAADRAFVGMFSDNTVGFYGNPLGGGLSMDVTTGAVGVRISPYNNYGLYLNGGAFGSAPAMDYGAVLTGGNNYTLWVGGRMYDYSLRSAIRLFDRISTTSVSYVNMPGMQTSVTVPPNISRFFQILVFINGVQCQGSNMIGAYFRILIDGSDVDASNIPYDRTRAEFHNNGWELRGVTLSTLISLPAGSHSIVVQWAVTTGGTLTVGWYNDLRQLHVVEL